MVFPNPDAVLLPGMFVRATVEEGVLEHAVLAPQEGVTRDANGNASALVVDGSGKAAVRSIVTDRAIGDRWPRCPRRVRGGHRPRSMPNRSTRTRTSRKLTQKRDRCAQVPRRRRSARAASGRPSYEPHALQLRRVSASVSAKAGANVVVAPVVVAP